MARKDCLWTKTDERILVNKLETLYFVKYYDYKRLKDNGLRYSNKTNYAKRERQLRLRLKSIELILHEHGSQLFEHAKSPSIRRTLELDAWVTGTIKSKDFLTRNRDKVGSYRQNRVHVST